MRYLMYIYIYIYKGILVHSAPPTLGSKKGQMYATLHPHAEKPFPYFKPITLRLQQGNLTIAPRPILTRYPMTFIDSISLMKQKVLYAFNFKIFLNYSLYNSKKNKVNQH